MPEEKPTKVDCTECRDNGVPPVTLCRPADPEGPEYIELCKELGSEVGFAFPYRLASHQWHVPVWEAGAKPGPPRPGFADLWACPVLVKVVDGRTTTVKGGKEVEWLE